MKTIRVFVSSTGDVQKERILADRAIRSVAGEFNVPVSALSNFQRLAEDNGEKTESENHETLILCPYFLEYQRFQSDAGYRGQIPNPAEFDLVISILWSRLGACWTQPDDAGWQLTRLRNGIRSSGRWTTQKEQRRSALHVYRNCSKPTPPLEPKEECEVFIRQWNSLQEFLRVGKRTARKLRRTCNEYRDLQEFEELFGNISRLFVGSGGTGDRTQGLGQESAPVEILSVPRVDFFDFEHAPIFHGRTKAIGEVLEALEAQVRAQRPFVLVVGASGSGKARWCERACFRC